MITNDSRYVSHHVIYADITRKHRQKTINIDDVMEWCGICETRYTKDVDLMAWFVAVDLEVDTDNKRALLPCNVFRIFDVFSDENDDSSRVEYYNTGTYLSLPEDYALDYVFITYAGIPVNELGEPLIIKGHENACETFCKLQIFEEDVCYGKFDKDMYLRWDDKFSGQLINAKTDMRHFDRDHFNKLIVIRGNMIPKIGVLSLYHNNFRDA